MNRTANDLAIGLHNAEAENLVVVGAAAGIGRWLCDHVLDKHKWRGVLLIDISSSMEALVKHSWSFSERPSFGVVVDSDVGPPHLVDPITRLQIGPVHERALVCLAVPSERISSVSEWLVPMLSSDSVLFETSPSKVASQIALAKIADTRSVFGIHPLFESSARMLDGQTVFVTPSTRPGDESAHEQLSDLIKNQGGTIRLGAAFEHDHLMHYVQAMSHRTLMAFVDGLVSSDLELGDLWEVRTPLFEALFGLAVRVIEARQEHSIASIQIAAKESEIGEEILSAHSRLSSMIVNGSVEEVEKYISDLREVFSGSLFDAVRLTASASVTAAQSKRAELSRRRRTGELTGLRMNGSSKSVRVGRVDSVTPTDVTLEEWMFGSTGAAALVEGPSKKNAERLGIGGKPKKAVFRLAHVDLVLGDELEETLSTSLGSIDVDVRFLVPESVAGEGVLSIVAPNASVTQAGMLSEVVRTGQRAVALRLSIRADNEVSGVIEDLQEQVQSAYSWPEGLALPAVSGLDPVVYYLGPAGTFSETAAIQCANAAGLSNAETIPKETFEAVLSATQESGIGVIPISSSSSGLVSRSAVALLEGGHGLVAGGVVDVAVRFDAYMLPGRQLNDVRGAPVFSHPQGLAQCTRFIERWELMPVSCGSTKASLEQLVLAGRGVALAGVGQGHELGLEVAEREIDDLSGSITRFMLLGPKGAFGHSVGGSDPTLRSLWLSDSIAPALDLIAGGGSAFDEILTDEIGHCLWVTSRKLDPDAFLGGLRLGRAPWSPRTPLVRVAASSWMTREPTGERTGGDDNVAISTLGGDRAIGPDGQQQPRN